MRRFSRFVGPNPTLVKAELIVINKFATIEFLMHVDEFIAADSANCVSARLYCVGLPFCLLILIKIACEQSTVH